MDATRAVLLVSPIVKSRKGLCHKFSRRCIRGVEYLVSGTSVTAPGCARTGLLLNRPLAASPITASSTFRATEGIREEFGLEGVILAKVSSNGNLVSVINYRRSNKA